MNQATVREAVGVFHDAASLQAAADEFMLAGFDRSDLSLLAGHRAVEAKLGHVYERVNDLEDEPRIATRAYIGTDSLAEAKGVAVGGLAYVGAVAAAGLVVASGGTIAAVLGWVAAAGGAGGLIGAALARVLGRRHADYLQEQLDHGGLLLWVHTRDVEHERRAEEILRRYGAEDVHLHDLPAQEPPAMAGLSHELSFMNRLGL